MAADPARSELVDQYIRLDVIELTVDWLFCNGPFDDPILEGFDDENFSLAEQIKLFNELRPRKGERVRGAQRKRAGDCSISRVFALLATDEAKEWSLERAAFSRASQRKTRPGRGHSTS